MLLNQSTLKKKKKNQGAEDQETLAWQTLKHNEEYIKS